MFFSSVFWVEVWCGSPPILQFGFTFLVPFDFISLLLSLSVCNIVQRAAVRVCSQCCLPASAWPASDFSHSRRGQTYVKLCEVRLPFSVSSLKQSQSLSDSDVISYTTEAFSQPENATWKCMVNFLNNFPITGGGGGKTETPAIIHGGGPFCEASVAFSEVPGLEPAMPTGLKETCPSFCSFHFLTASYPHFFLGSPE